MKRLQKKICMIGDFAVGKTSLVSRFVRSTFSDKYLTTVGVKIDTKLLTLDKQGEVKLILWDIAGENQLSSVSMTYLRGASGYLLIIDGLRKATLEAALNLKTAVDEQLHHPPFVTLINKVDLMSEWEITPETLEKLRGRGWPVLLSSAKTGEGVEEAFQILANQIVGY